MKPVARKKRDELRSIVAAPSLARMGPERYLDCLPRVYPARNPAGVAEFAQELALAERNYAASEVFAREFAKTGAENPARKAERLTLARHPIAAHSCDVKAAALRRAARKRMRDESQKGAHDGQR